MSDPKNSQVDTIIKQLQEKLRDGSLKPGEKIPSERVLADEFNTTRGYIRKAIARLEHYGVLEVAPQKGIYIPLIQPVTLDALINNILNFNDHDILSLLETRSNLEIFSARLAATRGNDADFNIIKKSHDEFIASYEEGNSTLEEDHLFHLAIAKATKNSVLESLITLVTPEIIAMNRNFKEDYSVVVKNSINEHASIVDAILAKDAQQAAHMMAIHMEKSQMRRMNPSRNQIEKEKRGNT